jgi:hypothetical protein
MGRAVAHMKRGEECIRGLGRKARRKEKLGRSRRRWEDNVKIDLRKIVWGDINWIHLAQDTTIKCWKVLEQLSN